MKSTNPVLSGSAFRVVSSERLSSTTMSVKGTAYKALLLLLCTILSASYIWTRFFTEQNPAQVSSFIMMGGIGGFILALVTIFKKEWAQYTSIPYAILEGVAIGGISGFFEQRFPGIAVQATALTFGVLGIMLVLYTNKIIVVTDKLKKGIIAATLAVGVVYLVSFIMGIFGVNLGFLQGSSPFSILISFVIVGIAAFNLLLDFDLIEEGSRQGAPKYMEWYAAFGLMVTLIWLYLEILRLLSKIRDNKR